MDHSVVEESLILAASSVLQPQQSLGKAEIDFQDVAKCEDSTSTISKVVAFTHRRDTRSLSEDDFHDALTSTRCREDTSFTYRRNKSLQNLTLDYDDFSCPNPMRFDVKTAQRSSARAVKDLLAKVDTICREQHQQRPEKDSTVLPPPPMEELSILANWAKDSYYVVVMIKNECIPITVSAMHAFSPHPEFLVVCCQMLKSFCEQGECYQNAVKTSGSVDVMLGTLRNHPGSSIVQYAVCEALESLTCSLPT
jgi:hypothetical protein